MSQWTNYFAHPEFLWLMPLLGLVGLTALWGRRQKQKAMFLLGRAGAVQKMLLVEPRARRWRSWCVFLALPLVLIGAAGPRWGRDVSQESVQGHDVVVLLDVSHSMLAEQPSRQERALRALRDLADHLQKRGGQRLALVVFAAQPHLVFPLTHDYDHFRQALGNIEAGDLPVEIRPPAHNPPSSGTRIGAALRLAVKAFETETNSPRALLLLSDGDDPARDEKEWLQGVHDARALQIPVHTIGFGDPKNESAIFVNGEFLRYDNKIIKTRLEEAVLHEIAGRTGGTYVPAQTSNLALGTLLPTILKNNANDPTTRSLAALPVLHPRQGWFLGLALALFTVALLLRDARIVQQPTTTPAEARPSLPGPRFQLASAIAPGFAVMVLAIMQLGAASPDEDWIRQANTAFGRNDLDMALALYEKAEATTTDPGLVAFNKAAVLYRLKRYREAELHYLRSIDDEQAPNLRQAQALFGLGIALLRQAKEKDVAILDRAIDSFTACVQKNASPELTTDAEYNLELARWLRLKAGPAPSERSNEEQPMNKGKNEKQQAKGKDEQPMKKGENSTDTGEPKKDDQVKGADDPAGSEKLASKLANAGALQSIPDDDTLQPLPPEDTEAQLQHLAERILQERRRDPRRRTPTPPQVKDW